MRIRVRLGWALRPSSSLRCNSGWRPWPWLARAPDPCLQSQVRGGRGPSQCSRRFCWPRKEPCICAPCVWFFSFVHSRSRPTPHLVIPRTVFWSEESAFFPRPTKQQRIPHPERRVRNDTHTMVEHSGGASGLRRRGLLHPYGMITSKSRAMTMGPLNFWRISRTMSSSLAFPRRPQCVKMSNLALALAAISPSSSALVWN